MHVGVKNSEQHPIVNLRGRLARRERLEDAITYGTHVGAQAGSRFGLLSPAAFVAHRGRVVQLRRASLGRLETQPILEYEVILEPGDMTDLPAEGIHSGEVGGQVQLGVVELIEYTERAIARVCDPGLKSSGVPSRHYPRTHSNIRDSLWFAGATSPI